MDEETRGHLHQILFYLQESEAKSYYRQPEDDRDGHVYHSARFLIRGFNFEDLIEADGAYWLQNSNDTHFLPTNDDTGEEWK